jgi:hypothetical protein
MQPGPINALTRLLEPTGARDNKFWSPIRWLRSEYYLHWTANYKTWFKVSFGLKSMLSLLFAKRVTVTASVLNKD